MPKSHRHFLLTFKRGQPDWDLLAVPNAGDLPAVRWKQRNLNRLSEKERRRLAAELEKILFDAAGGEIS